MNNECKKYFACKKYFSWNPSTCICENGRYLKSVLDNSLIECSEITNVTDSASRYKMGCYI